ncbi:hypothetical protein BCEP4_680049 [Burkholderia cepacia]|nr:hypothetical protein BCEP4_680049 [Burkholderia cepacia]
MGPGQPGRHPRVHDARNVRRDQDRPRFARQRVEPDRRRAARRGTGRDRGSRHRAVGERAFPRPDPRIGECVGRAVRRGVEPVEVGQSGLAARGHPADQHALSVSGGHAAGRPGNGRRTATACRPGVRSGTACRRSDVTIETRVGARPARVFSFPAR